MQKAVIIRFITVSFNDSNYTRRLLESLDRQRESNSGYSIECIVIDNSIDENNAAECKEVLQRYSWATYARPSTNIGYFGGLNYGMSLRDLSGASYVVVCNNDLEFESDFCSTLATSRHDSRVFSLCPDVITADGLHQNPHFLTRISIFRRLQFDVFYAHYCLSRLLLLVLRVIRPVKSSPSQPTEACEIHMGVGACYVLTREFLGRFGRLEYPFFLYGEEAYIAEQIHSAGGTLWYEPRLRVCHAESAALSKIPSRTAYELAKAGYSDYRRLL